MSATEILVVEDERLVALAIKNELEEFGYHVTGIVSTASDAVEMADETRPDLVLMDIHLKGGDDGIEAAQRIHGRYGVPVVYLSAFSDSETVARASSTEAFGYLLKPYEKQELRTTIEMAVAKHRVERELEETRRWLSAVYDGIDDAVIAVGPDRRVRFMNLSSEALTGWGKSEGVGVPLAEIANLILIQRDRLIDWESLIAETIRSSQRVDLPVSAWLTNRGGRGVPVEGTVSPIYGPQGELLGVVAVLRNIAVRLELENLRWQSEEQKHQTQKLDAVSRLAAGIAQHLNNQLTTILHNASLSLAMMQESGEARTLLEHMERAAQQAAGLVQRLNLFATIANRQAGPLPEANLASIVGECLKQIELRLKPDIELHCHAADDLWPVAADQLLLGQALLELALNAQDAMPCGGELRIELENVAISEADVANYPGGQMGEFVRLRVRDNVQGLPTTDRPRVPELCSGTNELGKPAGLPLPLVTAIVEHHHGWIHYVSDVNQGTRFDLFFPRYGTEATGEIHLPNAERPHGAVSTVLLCEADPLLRDVGQRILEGQGYGVLVAQDGAQTVKTFCEAQQRIDLAILDLNSPRLSAYAVLERLVELDPQVKVIIAGGCFRDDLNTASGHAVGVISKPYRREDLITIVQRALTPNSELASAREGNSSATNPR
jgi:two-component system, cell cycle sensor histidine kinase and response regulator CckA